MSDSIDTNGSFFIFHAREKTQVMKICCSRSDQVGSVDWLMTVFQGGARIAVNVYERLTFDRRLVFTKSEPKYQDHEVCSFDRFLNFFAHPPASIGDNGNWSARLMVRPCKDFSYWYHTVSLHCYTSRADLPERLRSNKTKRCHPLMASSG